jgi:hypothetical protein
MKFGEVILWIIIIIVASLVVSMIINPAIYTNTKNKVVALFKTSISRQDSLEKKCVSSFEVCKDIYEKRYGIFINISESKKVENMSDGDIFFNNWKGQSQVNLKTEFYMYALSGNPLDNSDFPLVLFAVMFRTNPGPSSYVVICNKNGELIRTSKIALSCA